MKPARKRVRRVIRALREERERASHLATALRDRSIEVERLKILLREARSERRAA